MLVQVRLWRYGPRRRLAQISVGESTWIVRGGSSVRYTARAEVRVMRVCQVRVRVRSRVQPINAFIKEEAPEPSPQVARSRKVAKDEYLLCNLSSPAR